MREQREQKALAATSDEREALCREWGVSRPTLDSLMHPQKCGELPQGDMERFGTGPPKMSVGFVSVAAGVAPRAQMVRVTELGAQAALEGCKDVLMPFRAPGLRREHLTAQPSCKCQGPVTPFLGCALAIAGCGSRSRPPMLRRMRRL